MTVKVEMIEDLLNEIWMPVVGFEGLYEVSDQGRVKSLFTKKERIIKPFTNNSGYLRVNLHKKGQKPKKFYVHRLVALSFIPNPLNKPEANHQNGNTLDNRLENLNWMTSKENTAHAIELGLFKLNNKPVIATNLDTLERLEFKSMTEAANQLGVHIANLHKVLKGKRNQTNGWMFQRVI